MRALDYKLDFGSLGIVCHVPSGPRWDEGTQDVGGEGDSPARIEASVSWVTGSGCPRREIPAGAQSR